MGRPDNKPSENRFRFLDADYDWLCKVPIPLSLPNKQLRITVEMDIVNAYIPALLGMDLLDWELLTPCTVLNRLMKLIEVRDKNGNPIIQ